MGNYGMTDNQLDCEIEERDIACLAEHFDSVELYLGVFELSNAEQTDVKNAAVSSTQTAMIRCLSLWRRHNPSTATLRALLEILLRLRKVEIASKFCSYYRLKHNPREAPKRFTNNNYYWIISLIALFIALNFGLYAYRIKK